MLTDIGELPEDDEGEEMELDFTVTRDQLNELARPLFQRAIDKTKSLLKNNDLSASDLSALVLVGGPTQMPLLRDMVEEQLIKPDISINPMTGIAEGAALYASTMENKIKAHGSGSDSGDDDGQSALELEVGYESPTNLEKGPISVLVKGSPEPLFGEIQSDDGLFTTDRAALDAVFEVDINQAKANNFTINVFNEKNELHNSARYWCQWWFSLTTPYRNGFSGQKWKGSFPLIPRARKRQTHACCGKKYH